VVGFGASAGGLSFFLSLPIIDEPSLLAKAPAATRERMLHRLEEDAQILVWWGTPVEVVSALARREREGHLTADDVTEALRMLRRLIDSWHEIVPSDPVRRTAERLLRFHSLRAADSLQLAAAVTAADDPSTTNSCVWTSVSMLRHAARVSS
jgi:predicted nucleic acid-binding protein